MKAFPVLISIPHGGNKIPPELQPYCDVSKHDMYVDGDPHTIEIYNLNNDVIQTSAASIARCFVDLNRSVADLPPANPDGVFKTVTLYGKKIYKNDWFPNLTLQDLLLRNYYHPYHDSLRKIESKNIELVLDCHSMLPYPPSFGAKQTCIKELARPSICLGNLGDELGNPLGSDLTSCSKEVLQQVADGFKIAFEHEDITITFNTPFRGGYITKSLYTHSRVPTVQVELNRALYMSKPYIDEQTNRTKKTRLDDLNQKFRMVLRYLYK